MSFLKDIFQDVTFTINERIKNPYWFSFLLAFIYWNWKSLLRLKTLLATSDQASSLIQIGKLDFHFLLPILFAFFGVIIFYVVQYFGMAISVVFQDNIKPLILSKLSNKRVVTRDKTDALKSFVEELQKKNDELDAEVSKLRKRNSELEEVILNHEKNEGASSKPEFKSLESSDDSKTIKGSENHISTKWTDQAREIFLNWLRELDFFKWYFEFKVMDFINESDLISRSPSDPDKIHRMVKIILIYGDLSVLLYDLLALKKEIYRVFRLSNSSYVYKDFEQEIHFLCEELISFILQSEFKFVDNLSPVVPPGEFSVMELEYWDENGSFFRDTLVAKISRSMIDLEDNLIKKKLDQVNSVLEDHDHLSWVAPILILEIAFHKFGSKWFIEVSNEVEKQSIISKKGIETLKLLSQTFYSFFQQEILPRRESFMKENGLNRISDLGEFEIQ